MAMQADIGVIITARNYARYLPRCIESVLAQGETPPWSLLIVDDGSADQTPAVIAGYRNHPRVATMRLPGVGLAAAGNAGIARLATEWILRLDADDWLLPGAVAALHGHVLSAGADAAYGELCLIDAADRELFPLSQDPAVIGDGMIRSPVGSGMLFRRRAWDAVGGYDESLRYQEDFDFWLRFTERFHAVHLRRAVYAYRQHRDTMSSNRRERAAARREVKRRAVKRRGLTANSVHVVLATGLPIAARAAGTAALALLNGETLLERLLRQLGSEALGVAATIVSGEGEVERWARKRGLAVMPPAPDVGAIGDPRLLERQAFPVDAEFVLVISPYYPFLEPARFAEALDTLLLGGLGRLDTAVAEPFTRLLPEDGEWLEADGPAEGAALPGALRLAGGVTAFHRPQTRRGALEIFPPEDFLVTDARTLALACALATPGAAAGSRTGT